MAIMTYERLLSGRQISLYMAVVHLHLLVLCICEVPEFVGQYVY